MKSNEVFPFAAWQGSNMCICAVRKIKLTLTIRYASELLSLQQMCSKFQCALTITIYFNASSPDTNSWEPNSRLVEVRGRFAIGISVGKICSLLCLKAIRWMQNERKWMRLPLEVPRTWKKHMSGIFVLELSHADKITTALHELARGLFKAFTGHWGVQTMIFQCYKSDSAP